MRPAVWILLLMTGCVLSVEERATFDEDIHTIVVDVSKGDVDISAAAGDIVLQVDFGGIGGGDVGHSVTEGVLTIDYDCGGLELCGGDLQLAAPARTVLDIRLGAGDITVSGMRGDLEAALGAGSVLVEDHGTSLVVVDTGAGDVQATFDRRPLGVDLKVATGSITLEVPAGSYALDLEAGTGTIDVRGIEDDPASDVLLRALTGAGTIEVAATR
jgi:hypothetical protein